MMEEEEEDVLFDQAEMGGGEEDLSGDQDALLPHGGDHSGSSTDKYSSHRPFSRCLKYYSTFCLAAAFFGLGLCLSIPGPTLLDLQQQTNTDTETISRLFTGRSVGYLLGSVVSGVLFDRLNQPCLISVSLLLTAVGTAAAPWCRTFHWLLAVVAFQGLSMGFLDTGGNVMCLQIWGEDNGPWMQALHFSFGMGAFVAPLLAEPFLSKKNFTNTTVFMVNGTTDPYFTVKPSAQPLQERSLEEELSGLSKFEKRDGSGQKRERRAAGLGGRSEMTAKARIEGVNRVGEPILQPLHLGKVKRGTWSGSFALEEKLRRMFDDFAIAWVKDYAKKKKKSEPTTISQHQSVIPITKAQVFRANKQDTNKTRNTNEDEDDNIRTPQNIVPEGPRPRPRSRGNGPQNFGVDIGEDSESGGESSGEEVNQRPRPPDDRGDISPDFGIDKEKEPKRVVGHAADPQRPDERPNGTNRARPRPSGPGRNVPPSFGLETETSSGEEDTDLGGGQGRLSPRRPRPNRPGNNNNVRSGFGINQKGKKGKRNSEETSETDVRSVTASSFILLSSTVGKSTLKDSDDEGTENSESDKSSGSGKKKARFQQKGSDDESRSSNSKESRFKESWRKIRKKREGPEENQTRTTSPANDSPVNATHGTGSNIVSVSSTTAAPKKPKVLVSGNMDEAVASGKILKGLDTLAKVAPKEQPEVSTQSVSDKDTVTINGTSKPAMNQTSHLVISTAPYTSTVSTTAQTTTQTTTIATTLATIKEVKTEHPAVPNDTLQRSTIHDVVTTESLNLTDQPDATQNNSVFTKMKDDLNYAILTFEETISGLTTVQFAYLIIACYVQLVSMLFLIMCCRTKCTLTAIKVAPPATAKSTNYRQTTGFKIQLLVLLFLFFFLYVGSEITIGGLLLTFSVDYLGWNKSAGTLLTSVFWGSFATARGLAIIFAKCLSPPIMLILDLVLTNLSLLAIVLSIDSNPNMLWYCTVVLGVGMASIFPTGISWAERYIDLTSRATAVFVVGSALGEMCVPAFTGYMFENKSPMWLIYITFAMAVLSIVIYIIMQNLASNSGVKYAKFSKLHDTTLTELDDADLEMESIPLTPDLELPGGSSSSSVSHTMSGYGEQNGSVSKSRKKVTFNFKEEGHLDKIEVTNRARGSILKGKGLMKTS